MPIRLLSAWHHITWLVDWQLCCSAETGLVQAIASLAALTSLRSLVLADCGAITSNGVAALGSLTGLTSLAVVRCPRIADKGLALLATLPHLRRLDIIGCLKVSF